MLIELSIRNAVRSWKDYLIFFLTLTLVTALMFSFDGLLWHPDIQVMLADGLSDFTLLLGMATVFILLVAVWLLQYMIRFMMQKRSREFASYLLMGMKRGQIARLFWGESLCLGGAAFLLGIAAGLFLQQFLFTCFYALIGETYRLHFVWSSGCFTMTALCYFGCYLAALLFRHRIFRKMNIAALLRADRKNEEIREGSLALGLLQFFTGSGYLIFFCLALYRTPDGIPFIPLLIGLVLAVYLLYAGLSSFLLLFIRKDHSNLHKGTRLFTIRQLSAKIRTMRFTCGTLTLLLSLAILGCSFALMLNRFQKTELTYKYPFSLSVIGNASTSLDVEKDVILSYAPSSRIHTYRIYCNGTKGIQDYLLTHLRTYQNAYTNADGSFSEEKASADPFFHYHYYEEDTFMKLSDYNALRHLLGLPDASVSDNGYLLQTKSRIAEELGGALTDLSVPAAGEELQCEGVYTDGFCQDGHNGADYLLIVSDRTAAQMDIYYSGLAAMLPGPVGDGLTDALWDVHTAPVKNFPFGSDQLAITISDILDAGYRIREARQMYVLVMLPLVYIGLVYLCTALTILSVQLLSDSSRSRAYAKVLSDLGLGRKKINHTFLWQMFLFYLCPALTAVLISGISSLTLGLQFFDMTGIAGSALGCFGYALLFFGGIYALYFASTYVSFTRSIWKSVP